MCTRRQSIIVIRNTRISQLLSLQINRNTTTNSIERDKNPQIISTTTRSSKLSDIKGQDVQEIGFSLLWIQKQRWMCIFELGQWPRKEQRVSHPTGVFSFISNETKDTTRRCSGRKEFVKVADRGTREEHKNTTARDKIIGESDHQSSTATIRFRSGHKISTSTNLQHRSSTSSTSCHRQRNNRNDPLLGVEVNRNTTRSKNPCRRWKNGSWQGSG